MRSRSPNVFVLTVDSLQYPSFREAQTRIADAIGAVEFTNAVSTAPQTASAMPGLAAGVYHDAIPTRGLPESGDPRPLAEILADHGYSSGLWTDNFLFGAEYNYDRGFSAGNLGRPTWKKRVANAVREGPLSPLFGALEWGYFTLYARIADAISNDSAYYRTAGELHDGALRWLNSTGDSPTLCWIHYMDTHHPYQPPAEYLRDRSFHIDRTRSELGQFTRESVKSNGEGLSAEDVADVATAYDACCEYIGDELYDFVETLQREGHFDPAADVLVLTADHGEHLVPEPYGMMGHLPAAYWEGIVRVPLVISRPDWDRRTVHEQVSLIDVMPTILRAVDVPIPETVAGRGAPDPGDLHRRYAFSLSQPYAPEGPTRTYRSVRAELGWKLFGADRRSVDETVLARFDLDRPADERIVHTTTNGEPPTAAAAETQWDRLLRELERSGPPVQVGERSGDRSEALETHLRDLGYLE
jgi:arylsulfatase A-like enzyme